MKKDITNQSIKLSHKIVHVEVEQKHFCIIIKNDLNFQSQTMSIMKTANQNLRVLIGVLRFMTDFNEKVIFNSFINPLLCNVVKWSDAL